MENVDDDSGDVMLERENGDGGEEEGDGVDQGVTRVVRLRGHWTRHEDDTLRRLVAEHGAQTWNVIAQHLPGRTGKSCRLRWYNQLDPKIRKAPFSEAEDEQLLAAHELYGNKWALIAKQFPGRTDNTVKNQWHVLMARKRRIEEAGGDQKRMRLADGGYRKCRRARDTSVGPSSSGENSGVTGNSDAQVSVNTDLCLCSSFVPVHDEASIKEDGGTGIPLSTGTESYQCPTVCSLRNFMFVHLALELHPCRVRKENVPFFDFMGVGDQHNLTD